MKSTRSIRQNTKNPRKHPLPSIHQASVYLVSPLGGRSLKGKDGPLLFIVSFSGLPGQHSHTHMLSNCWLVDNSLKTLQVSSHNNQFNYLGSRGREVTLTHHTGVLTPAGVNSFNLLPVFPLNLLKN